MRDWLIRRLGGIPPSAHAEMMLSVEHSYQEVRQRLVATIKRLKDERAEHDVLLARRINRGEPVACPECGDINLRPVWDNSSGKKMVACRAADHRSTWSESGVLFKFEQCYRQRIKDEERRVKR